MQDDKNCYKLKCKFINVYYVEQVDEQKNIYVIALDLKMRIKVSWTFHEVWSYRSNLGLTVRLILFGLSCWTETVELKPFG